MSTEHVSSFFFFFFLVFFFLFSGCSSSPSLSNPDFEALQSFKESLLEPSQALSSWVNSSSPCSGSWFGVTCNPKNHRVTRLVLENLNLTGSINSLARLSQLRLLSLKQNYLSCSSNFNVSSWRNLKHLYLSYNRLSGTFPSGVSRLRRLHRLDISHNFFSGDIPMEDLATLPRLLTLRLEDNYFTGTINFVNPLSSSILEFNVSDNNLSGKIPTWLSKFPASSFSGNNHLCGEPLKRECSNQTVQSQPVESKTSINEKKASNWLVMLIVGIDALAILAVATTITFCCYCRRRKSNSGSHGEVVKRKSGSHPQIGAYYHGGAGGGLREGEEMVVFEGCKGFNDVDDLLKSSAELLGKGSVGTTYKVEMTGGDVVVVKRVRERRRRRDVHGWLRLIGGLRHSNIVSLRAYYNSKDELLLVYDFLPNGSLHSLLHGNRGPGRTPLEWRTRLKLASGAAQGLSFFHGYNKAKLFHGNLTSSNILVDQSGNSCISDIGLHQLLHSPTSSNTAYKPPELITPTGKYTQKCDVYSFGVILLEILTGKMPNGEGETSLVRWVQRVKREEWIWEVFDFELLRSKEMEEEMVALMQVALLCLASSPRDRPKMNMVHRMIEDIRTKNASDEGGDSGSSNSIMNDISSDSSPSPSENTNLFYYQELIIN
ncbi:hypothetical protein JCGZ_07665 [Jatropha curcas]|uniref:Protein kinase domain-containing protein n=1 Tax=Jatropha curcas TaxID=180498 RepID=A0A067KQJ2_JATCU|nr:probable leucine-rich repeat receptor-like protein kinase At1g68400 [Jatropha curcas]KDP34094.1 hypothetical protein JCGZ_07665 [Jatropha curcas]